MDNSNDTEVLREAVEWLEEGDAVVLVTVVRTWGSAPRRPGAMMVIHADGCFVGSVSGGCVEDDLVQRVLRGEFENAVPRLIEYGISAASTRRIGLPCGGQLALVVEYIDAAAPLRKVLETVQARSQVARRVCLNTGEASLHPVVHDEGLSFDGENLVKVFGPSWRMLIIGAGELARRVSQLALTLDFAVTICDSRPEYASGWEVDGTEFTSNSPVDCINDFKADEHSVILALAHSPALEDEALAAALQSNAFYIGALGSSRNQQARLKRLQKLGVSADCLSRLHGPVGLAIGSHTPAEIAVAITAELVQSRNQQNNRSVTEEIRHG